MTDEPLDRIYIRDVRARCIIGVYPDERQAAQDVCINITLSADLRAACQTDRLEDTIDYKHIKQRVVAMVEDSSCFLVEHLAERVAALCLEEPRVRTVEVTVDKPGALRFARSVAVSIVRAQQAHG